jgi:hypothetical protein
MEVLSPLVASLAEQTRGCCLSRHDSVHISLSEDFSPTTLYSLQSLLERGSLVDGDLVLTCAPVSEEKRKCIEDLAEAFGMAINLKVDVPVQDLGDEIIEIPLPENLTHHVEIEDNCLGEIDDNSDVKDGNEDNDEHMEEMEERNDLSDDCSSGPSEVSTDRIRSKFDHQESLDERLKDFDPNLSVTETVAKINQNLNGSVKRKLLPTEIFICDVCGKEFNLKFQLNRHIARCHESSEVKENGQDVVTSLGLSSAISNEDDDMSRPTTQLEGGTPSKKLRTEIIYHCQKCGKSYQKNHKRHFLSHSEKCTGVTVLSDSPNSCPTCKKQYKGGAYYEAHVKKCAELSTRMDAEEELDEMVCSTCQKTFVKPKCFRTHIETCGKSTDAEDPSFEKSEKMVCSTCNKSFSRPGSFSKHVETCGTEKHKYKCSSCDKMFAYNGTYLKHTAECGNATAAGHSSITPEDDSDIAIPTEEDFIKGPYNKDKIICPHKSCLHEFDNSSYFLKHLAKHIGPIFRKTLPGKRCDECGTNFPDEYFYWRHISISPRHRDLLIHALEELKVNLPEKWFGLYNTDIEKPKEVKLKSNSIQCPLQCPKFLPNYSVLKNHVSQAHLGKEIYQKYCNSSADKKPSCSVCGKKLVNKNCLVIHLGGTHEKIFEFLKPEDAEAIKKYQRIASNISDTSQYEEELDEGHDQTERGEEYDDSSLVDHGLDETSDNNPNARNASTNHIVESNNSQNHGRMTPSRIGITNPHQAQMLPDLVKGEKSKSDVTNVMVNEHENNRNMMDSPTKAVDVRVRNIDLDPKDIRERLFNDDDSDGE